MFTKRNVNLEDVAKNIRLLVLDVDGVLTNGSLWYTAEGEHMKVFHAHDGYGLKMLVKHGMQIAIISGRDTPMVSKRMQEYGITRVYQNISDKLPVLDKLLQELGLNYSQVAYVGDDLPDLEPMQKVALSFAVNNATKPILKIATVMTNNTGGNGAVREVCDFLLEAQQS